MAVSTTTTLAASPTSAQNPTYHMSTRRARGCAQQRLVWTPPILVRPYVRHVDFVCIRGCHFDSAVPLVLMPDEEALQHPRGVASVEVPLASPNELHVKLSAQDPRGDDAPAGILHVSIPVRSSALAARIGVGKGAGNGDLTKKAGLAVSCSGKFRPVRRCHLLHHHRLAPRSHLRHHRRRLRRRLHLVHHFHRHPIRRRTRRHRHHRLRLPLWSAQFGLRHARSKPHRVASTLATAPS